MFGSLQGSMKCHAILNRVITELIHALILVLSVSETGFCGNYEISVVVDWHYSDVIMNAMAYQITGVTIVC